MLRNLDRLKPGGRKKSHLLLASLLWTIAGLILTARGMQWLVQYHRLILIVPALALGTLKSRFILDRTAIKSIARIQLLQDGTCLGAVYSVKTWMLVLLMMGMGMVLRHSPFPRPLLGMLYITIGWALFWSSRHGWRAWRETDRRDGR